MKDTEIHNGLPEKEVRDFLSKSISELINPVKTTDFEYDSKDILSYPIESCKHQIEYYKKELERLNNLYALILLIKSKGWDEYDCSDNISKTGSNFWRNFIGTEKEFNNFMKNFE